MTNAGGTIINALSTTDRVYPNLQCCVFTGPDRCRQVPGFCPVPQKSTLQRLHKVHNSFKVELFDVSSRNRLHLPAPTFSDHAVNNGMSLVFAERDIDVDANRIGVY